MLKDHKTKNGRFARGTGGNPAGRPPGSRNRSTAAMEALLEEDCEQLIQKAKQLAMKGNVYALRLCIERLLPPRKDRTIELGLPAMQTAEQILEGISTIIAAIGEGRITLADGSGTLD